MPSNGTLVCLDCRTTRRGSGFGERKCIRCHKVMNYIGQHWRVPKKDDDKEWKNLEKLIEVWERRKYTA